MGAFVDGQDEMQPINDEIAANQAAHDEYASAANRMRVGFVERLTHWSTHDLDEALAAGTVPGPKPTNPLDQQDHLDRLHRFESERQRLQEQRTAVLAGLVPRIEQQVADGLAQVTTEVRALAEQLKPLTTEANGLLADLHTARQAQYAVGRATGEGGRVYAPPGQYDAASLLDAVLRGQVMVPEPERRLGFNSNPWRDAPARELQLRGPDPMYPPEPKPA